MGEIEKQSETLRMLDGKLGAGITDAIAEAVLAAGGTLVIDTDKAPTWNSMDVHVEGTKITIKVV